MKKFLFSWSKFIANELATAVVANAAPTLIVLTFKEARNTDAFKNVGTTCFTTAGKVVDLVTINRAAKTVSIRVTVAYVAGAGFNLVFNPSKKGATQTIAITNNVL